MMRVFNERYILYDAIAANKEVFLYFSLSILAMGTGLGVVATLIRRYYRFTTGNADVFVHLSILYSYVEHYSRQAFPLQKPAIKICLNKYNQITIVFGSVKPLENDQVFEQIKKDLSALLSSYLGYHKPLFLEIIYN